MLNQKIQNPLVRYPSTKTLKVNIENKNVRDLSQSNVPSQHSRQVSPQRLQSSALSAHVPPSRSALSTEIAILIEKRNLDIIKFLLEQKYATHEQIQTKFFGFAREKQKAYFESALRKLLALEYISIKERADEKVPLIMATAKGHEFLKERAYGKQIPKLTTKIFEPEVRHDLILNDLRVQMENQKLVTKWFSEQSLECEGSLLKDMKDLPDALILSPSKKGSFLELEISMKGGPRYAARIEEYKKVLEMSHIKKALNAETAFASDSSVTPHARQNAALNGSSPLGYPHLSVIFICTDPKVFDAIKKAAGGDARFQVQMINQYLELAS